MAVTPTGMLSFPLANLRVALSACESFQEWVGVDQETDPEVAALDYIGLVERAASTGNFAVVDDGDEFVCDALDTGSAFSDRGNLVLLFQGDVGSGDANSETDAQLTFTNAVGAIIEELWTSVDRSVFSLDGLSKLWGPARAGDVERKGGADYVQMGFAVRWR